jgi:hypothetical protein
VRDYIIGEREILGPGDEDIMADLRAGLAALPADQERAEAARLAAPQQYADWQVEHLTGLVEVPLHNWSQRGYLARKAWWCHPEVGRFGKQDTYYELSDPDGTDLGYLAFYGGFLGAFAWVAPSVAITLQSVVQ